MKGGGLYPWVTVKSCQCFANGYVHYVDMVKIAVILNEHVQQVEEYKTQIYLNTSSSVVSNVITEIWGRMDEAPLQPSAEHV